jgi:hypothetical protein
MYIKERKAKYNAPIYLVEPKGLLYFYYATNVRTSEDQRNKKEQDQKQWQRLQKKKRRSFT